MVLSIGFGRGMVFVLLVGVIGVMVIESVGLVFGIGINFGCGMN